MTKMWASEALVSRRANQAEHLRVLPGLNLIRKGVGLDYYEYGAATAVFKQNALQPGQPLQTTSSREVCYIVNNGKTPVQNYLTDR